MRWRRRRARRNVLTRTVKSCGPDASTPASSWRNAISANDSDKKARSLGRARRNPLKPFACGNAGCSGEPRGVLTRMLFHFACEAAGATGTRRSPRPLFFEVSGWQDSGATRRGIAELWLRLATSLRGAKRRSNPIFAFPAARMDCFARARNDGVKPFGCLKSKAGAFTIAIVIRGLDPRIHRPS
jgi:hypothetical protein